MIKDFWNPQPDKKGVLDDDPKYKELYDQFMKVCDMANSVGLENLPQKDLLELEKVIRAMSSYTDTNNQHKS